MSRIEIEFGANFEKYMRDFGEAQRKTASGISSLQNTFSTIAGLSVFGYGASQLLEFGIQATKNAAQLEVLRREFRGTKEDIELFRKATAGTVTEANLIKMSNQAADLGLSIEQQALLMSLADDAADRYGTSVEEGFRKVLNASEGATKGLKEVGIQKAVYDSIVEKYLTELGAKNLQQLDAETQKWVQLQSLIEASGVTMESVINKKQDSADKLENIGRRWDEFTTGAGFVFLDMFNKIAIVVENAYGWLVKIGNLPKNLLGYIGIDISDERFGLGGDPVYGGGNNEKLAPVGSMERMAQDFNREKAEKQKRIDAANKIKLEEDRKKAEADAKKRAQKLDSMFKSDSEIQQEIGDLGTLLKGDLSLREMAVIKEKIKKLEDELYGYERGKNLIDAANKANLQPAGVVAIPMGEANKNLPTTKQQRAPEINIDPLLDIGSTWELIGDSANRATDIMVSGLTRAIFEGRNLRETLLDIGASLGEMTLNMLFGAGLRWLAVAAGIPAPLLGMREYANGGVINEPVYGIGKSGQSYLFGEAGSEVVIPANRFNYGASQTNVNVSVGGTLKASGNELHALIKRIDKLEKRYG